MSRWIPHNHRIVVKVDEVKELTKGGILIADTTRTKEQNQQVRATVMDVGSKAVVDAELIFPGARVLIAKWGGLPIPDSDLLRVISDEDICAVEVLDGK